MFLLSRWCETVCTFHDASSRGLSSHHGRHLCITTSMQASAFRYCNCIVKSHDAQLCQAVCCRMHWHVITMAVKHLSRRICRAIHRPTYASWRTTGLSQGLLRHGGGLLCKAAECRRVQQRLLKVSQIVAVKVRLWANLIHDDSCAIKWVTDGHRWSPKG
jgi:hypothetical protein